MAVARSEDTILMNKEKIITENVYARTKKSWGLEVWREMMEELYNSRELIWMLFLRDFKSRYKQSILGILWTVIQPVIAVATFMFLNRSGLLNVSSTGVPYPVYLLLGLTIWQVFAGGLVALCNSVVSGGSMVVKVNFPKETLVISAFGQVIFEVLIRMILLVIVMVIMGVAPGRLAVFFPLALIPILFMTLGLGMLLALFNVFLRDIGNALTVVLPFLMFLSPVIYPIPEKGALSMLMRYNPLTALIETPRAFLTGGGPEVYGTFALAGIASIAIFLVAWRLFHLTESRMAERI